MNFLSPAEVAASCCNAGKGKSMMAPAKLIILGILAGVYWLRSKLGYRGGCRLARRMG